MTYYNKQSPWQEQDAARRPKPPKPPVHPCPQQPGTLLRIFIPAGAVINLANLLEVSSPSGICLLVRVPALGNFNLNSIFSAVKQAGGTVEVVNN